MSFAAYILRHRETSDESINIYNHYIILILEDLLSEGANQYIIELVLHNSLRCFDPHSVSIDLCGLITQRIIKIIAVEELIHSHFDYLVGIKRTIYCEFNCIMLSYAD